MRVLRTPSSSGKGRKMEVSLLVSSLSFSLPSLLIRELSFSLLSDLTRTSSERSPLISVSSDSSYRFCRPARDRSHLRWNGDPDLLSAISSDSEGAALISTVDLSLRLRLLLLYPSSIRTSHPGFEGFSIRRIHQVHRIELAQVVASPHPKGNRWTSG